MTIALASAIAVPNVTRLRVVRVALQDDTSVAIVTLEARSPAATNRVYGTYTIHVANGDGTAANKSQRVKLNATPSTYGDAILLEGNIEIAGGYDGIEAAYRGGANKAAAMRAVETEGLAKGWIDASLAGTVA